MFKMEIVTEKFRKFLDSFVEKFSKSATAEIEDTLREVKRDMQVPGKPVTYPVDWDSEKQRRFVMAKLTEENNLPYKRTDQYINGWKIAPLPDGFSLSNAHPAGAIGGTLNSSSSLLAQGGVSLNTWQSKIHRGRWPVLLVVLLERVSRLPKRVIERVRIAIGK